MLIVGLDIVGFCLKLVKDKRKEVVEYFAGLPVNFLAGDSNSNSNFEPDLVLSAGVITLVLSVQ